jgi:hypothetical protein
VDAPNSPTAEAIRLEMRRIRRDLRANVKEAVANASQLFDWKSYVRSFPWTSLAIAGVVGYLLVPRRTKIIAYNKQAVEDFLKERNLVAAPPPPPSMGAAITRTLLQMAATTALRFGTAYLTKLSSDFFTGGAAAQPAAHDPFAHVRSPADSGANRGAR